MVTHLWNSRYGDTHMFSHITDDVISVHMRSVLNDTIRVLCNPSVAIPRRMMTTRLT